MKRSPLLLIVALLAIVASPILLFYKLNEQTLDLYYISDGVTADAIIEAKLDTTSKNLDGTDFGFISVSFPNATGTRPNSVDPIDQSDSSYIDSVSALKRMLRAENSKVSIPGLTFVRVEVEKKVFDSLQEGDPVKIIYSSYNSERVRLAALNRPQPMNKDNSGWIAGCIIAFIVGVWIIVMNKRRRKQEQMLDNTTPTFYSTIKKDNDPTKGGGRPV